jgi:hypothetical protein
VITPIKSLWVLSVAVAFATNHSSIIINQNNICWKF